MFSTVRTPLASPSLKQGFHHAKAYPFPGGGPHSPSVTGRMPHTPLLPPVLLASTSHARPVTARGQGCDRTFSVSGYFPEVFVPVLSAKVGPIRTRGDRAEMANKLISNGQTARKARWAERKANKSLRLNLTPAVISEEEGLNNSVASMSMTKVGGERVGNGGFKRASERVSTPYPRERWLD
ncbi:hypothetical protein JAAARDRAFT_516814 [Jaapia argillacea MUCL 33604]|uniref:Uncharacterized protein n=1 Tax=Jaapia argillacea MUCL 33604 TaxID=933084 RepID=A0A067Q3R9_9AGAM|nr:hypothetical protein JAAARDRAFT_516814 [Jaapia argillacea MUCL 33604]